MIIRWLSYTLPVVRCILRAVQSHMIISQKVVMRISRIYKCYFKFSVAFSEQDLAHMVLNYLESIAASNYWLVFHHRIIIIVTQFYNCHSEPKPNVRSNQDPLMSMYVEKSLMA